MPLDDLGQPRGVEKVCKAQRRMLGVDALQNLKHMRARCEFEEKGPGDRLDVRAEASVLAALRQARLVLYGHGAENWLRPGANGLSES